MQQKIQSQHYMLVPLNQQGLEIDMLQIGDPCSENFKEWALTEAETNSIINSLLFAFCEKFDVFIDISENRILNKEFIAEALNMAKDFEQQSKKDVQKKAAKKVIEALEFANSTSMPVWFWF